MRTGRPRLSMKSRIEKGAKTSANGCWLWQGTISPDGYGRIMVCVEKNKRVSKSAHREAYKAFKGEIPDGLELDHLCRVRNCVNPDHLEPVTRLENARRGIGGLMAGLRQRAKTHCPAGHPYAPENTYFRANGNRMCVTCNAAWCRRNYERRIAA